MLTILLLAIIIMLALAVSQTERSKIKCPYCSSDKTRRISDEYFYYGTGTTQKREPYECAVCGELFCVESEGK